MTATVYVETSALVRALTNRDPAVDEVLRAAPSMVTSALTLLEAARAISRHRREGDLSASAARDAQRRLAEFERSADTRSIDDEVLQHARLEFPSEPVRTLDAIQLATLRLFDATEDHLVLLSTDDRVRRNALALGFDVLPAAP
jgi:predicted nucleic acid-binding protein